MRDVVEKGHLWQSGSESDTERSNRRRETDVSNHTPGSDILPFMTVDDVYEDDMVEVPREVLERAVWKARQVFASLCLTLRDPGETWSEFEALGAYLEGPAPE
jgi:hypothetical protein